jgi:hypothetical protein
VALCQPIEFLRLTQISNQVIMTSDDKIEMY